MINLMLIFLYIYKFKKYYRFYLSIIFNYVNIKSDVVETQNKLVLIIMLFVYLILELEL